MEALKRANELCKREKVGDISLAELLVSHDERMLKNLEDTGKGLARVDGKSRGGTSATHKLSVATASAFRNVSAATTSKVSKSMDKDHVKHRKDDGVIKASSAEAAPSKKNPKNSSSEDLKDFSLKCSGHPRPQQRRRRKHSSGPSAGSSHLPHPTRAIHRDDTKLEKRNKAVDSGKKYKSVKKEMDKDVEKNKECVRARMPTIPEDEEAVFSEGEESSSSW